MYQKIYPITYKKDGSIQSLGTLIYDNDINLKKLINSYKDLEKR